MRFTPATCVLLATVVTACHDAIVHEPHVGAMTTPAQLPSPPARYCVGKIHADRRVLAALDPMARVGPTRIGLIEDGALFCRSCAYELARSVSVG
jgi:hypothetical protein